MKKIILILLLFSPLSIFASDEKPRLAVIVSFDCPYCYEMSGYISFINRYLSNNGYKELIIIPIVTNEKDKGIRESYFYAADALNKETGKKVMRVLFNLGKNRVPISSGDDLADWMEIEYPKQKETWNRIASKQGMSYGKVRLAKGINFALKSGFLNTPGFVKVSREKLTNITISDEKDMGLKIEKILQKFMEDN